VRQPGSCQPTALLSAAGRRAQFVRFNRQFSLMNIHILNLPLALLSHCCRSAPPPAAPALWVPTQPISHRSGRRRQRRRRVRTMATATQKRSIENSQRRSDSTIFLRVCTFCTNIFFAQHRQSYFFGFMSQGQRSTSDFFPDNNWNLEDQIPSFWLTPAPLCRWGSSSSPK